MLQSILPSKEQENTSVKAEIDELGLHRFHKGSILE
jgi:hypothetical protein